MVNTIEEQKEEQKQGQSERIYQRLGDDLVLRQATEADRENLIEFNRTMHDEISAVELRYLLDGLYSGCRLEDFLVVVDQTERIVSTLGLLEVPWRLGQTELRVGQPEFVGTLAEYRGRGLVRTQFEVLHRWMHERKLAFGVIGGIYYYYRLFGYEYAVDIHRAGYLTVERHAEQVKMLPDLEVRPIVESDIPTLLQLAKSFNTDFDLSLNLEASALQYVARNHRLAVNEAEEWIVLRDGQAVGSARIVGKPESLRMINFTGDERAGQALIATAMALPGAAKILIGAAPYSPVGRWVAGLQPLPRTPYAWYIRVNDPLLAFQQLTGEFERRVAASPFASLSRAVDLGCYRFGIQLVFENGKLTQINSLPGQQDPKIGLPPDLLPKLLMGYRDLNELAHLYPDLTADDDWELIRVLFPRLRSNLRFFI